MHTTPLRIDSVNVARSETLAVGDRHDTTGIFKRPAAGPVDILREGLRDDFIGDLGNHGGPDQAVYIYSTEDAAWWSQQLGRTATPGFFGENLDLDRWWPEVRVGDRLEVGTVVLELTAPRIPCATLAARAGDRAYVKAFAAARRPGAYARVLKPGPVGAGAEARLVPAPSSYPLLVDLFDQWYANPRDPATLRRALDAPLAARMRARFQEWLAPA